VNAAEDRGGRLDPPLLAVLDEAANVCRIADLPQLYSHLGSRGILPLTILQSYAQGEAVWGRTGMRTLWSAATVKLLGAGLDEAGFVEDVSRLVGDHDVPADSLVARPGPHHPDQLHPPGAHPACRRAAGPAQRQRAAACTGTRPALLSLLPWYDGPRAGAVASEVQTATAGISRRDATAGVR